MCCLNSRIYEIQCVPFTWTYIHCYYFNNKYILIPTNVIVHWLVGSNAYLFIKYINYWQKVTNCYFSLLFKNLITTYLLELVYKSKEEKLKYRVSVVIRVIMKVWICLHCQMLSLCKLVIKCNIQNVECSYVWQR